MSNNDTKRIGRYTLVFLILIVAFAAIIVLNITIGSVDISVDDIIKILFGGPNESTQYGIIWKIRMPRVFMAAILGGALSLAGFLLQTFFANYPAGRPCRVCRAYYRSICRISGLYRLRSFSIT